MKFLILSDIHCDHWTKNYILPQAKIDKDVMVLFAGDAASGIEEQTNFIGGLYPNNKVIFVNGNHDTWNEWCQPIEEQVGLLRKRYPHNSRITFLEKDAVEFGDVVILGATGWTNFNLYHSADQGKKDILQIKQLISSRFPDFDYNWVRISSDGVDVENITPAWMKKEFNKTMEFFKKNIEKYSKQNKKIIILTHFPLLKEFVEDKYKNNPTNVFFVNDVPELFNDKNIIAHIAGHTHSNFAKRIAINNHPVDLFCNALGYVDWKYEGINPNYNPKLIYDTDKIKVENINK